MLSQPVWQEISGIQDPELKELAESLPIVLQSRAPPTVKNTVVPFYAGKGGH